MGMQLHRTNIILYTIFLRKLIDPLKPSDHFSSILSPEQIRVVLGEHDILNDNESPIQGFEIQKYFIHEDYSINDPLLYGGSSLFSTRNNIAILELKNHANLEVFTPPCLRAPPQTSLEWQKASTYGIIDLQSNLSL